MKAQPWLIYPLETNSVLTVQEAGWAPEPVSPSAQYLMPTPGFKPQTIHPQQAATLTMLAQPTKY
jgi:hypothetical protein